MCLTTTQTSQPKIRNLDFILRRRESHGGVESQTITFSFEKDHLGSLREWSNLAPL